MQGLGRAITSELGFFGHTAPSHVWDRNLKLVFYTVLNDETSEIERDRDLCAR